MRNALIASALCLPLVGCFQPVDINGGTHDSGSSIGVDAARPPIHLDASAPILDDAGNPLPGPDAATIYLPDASTIYLPDASIGGCISDSQCPSHQICYSSGCADTAYGTCIPGCWQSTDCDPGLICQLVPNDCGDKNGLCVDPPGCTDDSQCPIGTACAPTGSGTQMYCTTGCHNDTNCPAGDTCLAIPCACPSGNCACLGICQAHCKSDADCPSEQLCVGLSTAGCTPHCAPGCYDDTGCHADETCVHEAPPCDSCDCVAGTCVAKGCQGDGDCPGGEVCSCNQCVPGCRSDADCPGGACVYPNCASCSCTPKCQPNNCQNDFDCPANQVCTGCPGQPLYCTPGCDDDKPCQPGYVCTQFDCSSCPCPSTCNGPPPPAKCQTDGDCLSQGAGLICAPCGISGANMCVQGCRDSSTCQAGYQCNTQIVCGYDYCCPAQCEPEVACKTDSDCGGAGSGMVCEPKGPGCNTTMVCVPGCHATTSGTSSCPAGSICEQAIDCLTCPCPGTCVQETCASGNICSSDLDCSWNATFCQNGCCTQCGNLYLPKCPDPGQCYQQQGIDVDGCQTAPTCAACCSCPADYIPVCSLVPNEYNGNFQTFGNQCQSDCAGGTVLHQGACLQYEGLGCGYPYEPQTPCPQGLTCRDMCAVCNSIQESRCAQTGSCIEQWDCPAGLTATCPAGTQPSWSCVSNACQYTCK